MQLNKKVAISTGAATGIGHAIAIAFAEHGAANRGGLCLEREQTKPSLESSCERSSLLALSHLHPSYQKPCEE
jgi:NAD(P)-dependent dehydrogenase (short-subunit alcohol dehydrogenase family)